MVAAGAETPLAAEDDSAGGVRGWVAGAEPWFGLGEAIVNGRAEMQDRKARLVRVRDWPVGDGSMRSTRGWAEGHLPALLALVYCSSRRERRCDKR